MIHTLTQEHLLSMMAPAATLRRVGRVDFDSRSASFFRFAEQLVKKSRPRSVMNAFGETMIMGHALDMQVFHTNDSETINELAALLMGEIIPPKSNQLMDT